MSSPIIHASLAIVGIAFAASVHANPLIRFDELADEPGAGLAYSRPPGFLWASTLAALQQTFMTPMSEAALNSSGGIQPIGKAGVAILDVEGDGDLDLYVANSSGSANSLFVSQLADSGSLTFVDQAVAAGVDATGQESSGVCYADIDNDGDHDLFVVAWHGTHRLFENRGDGTFTEITAASGGAFDSGRGSSACTFGDIDNDGLVDLFVTTTWALGDSYQVCNRQPFGLTEGDLLFENEGGGVFTDVSVAAGVRDLGPGLPAGAQSVTWAAAMVDYDQDGDVDIVTATDNCGVPIGSYGGVDRGRIELFNNDGTGHFENRTLASGTHLPGHWMGLAFADFNRDGYMDVFGTNLGDYLLPSIGQPYTLGDSSSRWLLGGPGGSFTDPGVGELVATPFGWGVSAEDFDNDGDTDIAFMGGLETALIIESSNAGSVLVNDGGGRFAYDPLALDQDNNVRNPNGVAAGDLNSDGFVDLVSVSTFDLDRNRLIPFAAQWGSPFDATALAEFLAFPVGPDLFVWTGSAPAAGSLSVQINAGDGGNHSVEVRLVGTVGLVGGAGANRDAVGAIATFSTAPFHAIGGWSSQKGAAATAMKPVLGGSSHMSQDSLELHFGLGKSEHGTLDVLWPGGTRNRLYRVHAGERIVFPEIPCSIDDGSLGFFGYLFCVGSALDDVERAGLAGPGQRTRIFASALLAFIEERIR